ncbi:copper ion binding protein, partial [Chloroflexota bacterium]
MSRPDIEMIKMSLPISGMTCASCATIIEKELSKKTGVIKTNVNLASEKAFVEYDPDKVNIKTLINMISDVGYGVATEKSSFAIGGMTCASCASNIEKALLGVRGVVSANINLASEKATVEYLKSDADISDFKKAVEGDGYGISVELADESFVESDAGTAAARREIGILRKKLIVSGIIGIYMFITMISELAGGVSLPPLLGNKYLLWVLATPVQFWAGWQFYKG